MLDLQPSSHEIWSMKHRLNSYDGIPIDQTVDDNFKRIAKQLSSLEKDPTYWENEFFNIMKNM